MANEFARKTDSVSQAASTVDQAVESTGNAAAAAVLSREEAVAELDARVDRKGILILFGAALLFTLHFVSGWTFDWTYDLF